MIFSILNAVAGFLLRIVYRLKMEGVERIPSSGPLIVSANHASNMDGPVLSVAVSRMRRPRFLGKRELFSIPVFGHFFQRVGAIPLDRHRSGGDVTALRAAARVLKEDGCLVVLPEGTRSRTGGPGRPKPGIGFLAHRTGTPVLPARIWNTAGWMRLSPFRIKFGSPRLFDPELLKGRTPKEAYRIFARQVMEDILALD